MVQQVIATKRGKKTAALWPRRKLVISLSQAVVATSLAVSILTFVFSLIEFLPVHQGEFAKQESLQYNTFVCVILPLVLAYCAQSHLIAAVTQRWVL